MAWIESHQELKDHPKTRKAMRLLGVSLPTVIGHLHLLWWWALDYAEDGNLSGFENWEIADAAVWEGDPSLFVEGLSNCGKPGEAGFIERVVDTDGFISIHLRDWDDYAGRLIDERKKNAARQKAWRDRQRNGNVTEEPSLLKRDSNDNITVTSQLSNRATVPNTTQHNSTQQTQEATADAAECAFQDFFTEFRETYPENADGKKPQMSRAMAAAKKVPVGDRPLVLLAVKHYAMSSSVQRGIVKYAQGFLNPTFWRDYLEEPTGGKGTNGKNKPKSARDQAIANGFRDAFGYPLEQAFGNRPSGEDEDYPAGSIRQLSRPGSQAG